MLDSRIAEVVGFWSQAGEAAWFSKNPELDAEIGRRFEQLHHAAARGELSDWAGHWQGSLALLILLDQFPRNLFRGSAHAYATDSLALSIAEQALKLATMSPPTRGCGYSFTCPSNTRNCLKTRIAALRCAAALMRKLAAI